MMEKRHCKLDNITHEAALSMMRTIPDIRDAMEIYAVVSKT